MVKISGCEWKTKINEIDFIKSLETGVIKLDKNKIKGNVRKIDGCNVKIKVKTRNGCIKYIGAVLTNKNNIIEIFLGIIKSLDTEKCKKDSESRLEFELKEVDITEKITIMTIYRIFNGWKVVYRIR